MTAQPISPSAKVESADHVLRTVSAQLTDPSATMVTAEDVLHTVNARLKTKPSATRIVESAEVKMNIEQTFTFYRRIILVLKIHY